jgi:putative tryptophan/tyrosine transport system substrate-binding protein
MFPDEREGSLMRRRDFIATVGSAAAWPLTARAQLAERRHRVSVLVGVGGQLAQSVVTASREELQRLGWIEGRNLQIDYRFSDGDPQRLARYADELANLQPDVILAFSGPAARAVQRRAPATPWCSSAAATLLTPMT